MIKKIVNPKPKIIGETFAEECIEFFATEF